MVDIFKVHPDPAVEAYIAAAVHLPETGYARFDTESSTLPEVVDSLYIPDREGSGADEAHFPSDDVQQLWEFIYAEAPQEHADPGDTRVASDLENRSNRFILLCSVVGFNPRIAAAPLGP